MSNQQTGRGSHSLKKTMFLSLLSVPRTIGDGPSTVSESAASNAELREAFGHHRVSGRELSEFLLAGYLGAKADLPSFFVRTHRMCYRTQ